MFFFLSSVRENIGNIFGVISELTADVACQNPIQYKQVKFYMTKISTNRINCLLFATIVLNVAIRVAWIT